MKNHEETKQAVFNRIHAYDARQKQKKKLMTKVAIPLCSFGIIATALFGFMQIPMEPPAVSHEEAVTESQTTSVPSSEVESIPPADQESTPPADVEDPPYTDDEDILSGDDDYANMDWSGKKVMSSLYEVLENSDPAEMLSIYAGYQGYDPQFVYEGKTLEAYSKEAEAEGDYKERMAQLFKLGDELKYGEALYLEGTPEGIKWYKNLYDGTVAYLGEDLLSKYIVDGEFLREQLEYDMEQTCENKAERALEKAYRAYEQFVLEDAWHQLESQGIQALVLGGELLLQVTVEQFRTLELSGLVDWRFGAGTQEEDFVVVPSTDDMESPTCD